MKKMNGDNSLIVKKILHTGTKEISFKNGTKVMKICIHSFISIERIKF